MTKDSLTYADVKQRLMDIDTSETSNDTALVASKLFSNHKKGQKAKKNGSSSSSFFSKTCNWCKKHNRGRSERHTWNEFFQLPKMNEEKRDKEHSKEKKQILQSWHDPYLTHDLICRMSL